jgi:hypothetical protein
VVVQAVHLLPVLIRQPAGGVRAPASLAPFPRRSARLSDADSMIGTCQIIFNEHHGQRLPEKKLATSRHQGLLILPLCMDISIHQHRLME